MTTEFYKITGGSADDAAISRAADIILAGGLVGFPTETVYGLGASALSETAAKKIYEAKGRPSDNPLIVHIACPEETEKIAFTTSLFYRLAERFMPGPLTVILPKKSCIPDGVTGGLDSVAVRCPANPVAHALIARSGVPIAAPSANRSGYPSPTSAEHVLRDMNGRIDMILDGGPCEIGLESTVIRLTDAGCEILRPGAVTEFMLSEVCGTVTVAKAVVDPSLAGEKPLSPGMKYKHYAPVASVILVSGTTAAFENYVRIHCTSEDAVAAADDSAQAFTGFRVLSFGKTETAEEESRVLFSILRAADDCGCKRLFIKLPPPEGGYLALYNRLIRAAGGKIVRAE